MRSAQLKVKRNDLRDICRLGGHSRGQREGQGESGGLSYGQSKLMLLFMSYEVTFSHPPLFHLSFHFCQSRRCTELQLFQFVLQVLQFRFLAVNLLQRTCELCSRPKQ